MPDAEPMIIDDGGSTRIKQRVAPAIATMDGLLNVLGGTSSAQANGDYRGGTVGGVLTPFKCRLQVRFHRPGGESVVDNGDLGPANEIVIESRNEQRLTLRFTRALATD